MPPPLAPDPTYLTPGVLRAWPLPSPQSDAGKERRGRVLVVGGSVETPGAALLAGLGTSGSGDVHAGTVAGLAARRAEPTQAALRATYVHGRAGNRLSAKVGRLGFLARELVAEIPTVLSELEA